MAAVVDRHWQGPPNPFYSQPPPYMPPWAASIPPKNEVEMTGPQLADVLEHFSKLLQQAFGLGQPGSLPSMRFVVHGGACMLLHPGLQRLSRQQQRNSPNMPRRTTTRDVDYLHRGFKKEYGHLPDAERKLKECIMHTAAAFKLGADWMNADADVALPMAKKPDGRTFDPIYDASLMPESVQLHTVYHSHNGCLTLISVSPFWAVALKLVRFAKWDPGDIVLLLRNGTVLSGVNWTAERIEKWLKTACWPMRYDAYSPIQMAGLRHRIQNSLKLLNDWNRDVVGVTSSGTSPPESSAGGRELTAWQTASNWQASAREPVTPQIAMGVVESSLLDPPHWAVNSDAQQSGRRHTDPREESPVRLRGRSLAANMRRASSRAASRPASPHHEPFIPPSPVWGPENESPESYVDDELDQDILAGPSRRSRSRGRQNNVPAWRGNAPGEQSSRRQEKQPEGIHLNPIDRALHAIIARGEETILQPGILNIMPPEPTSPRSPISMQHARRMKDKQRATERNRARGAKRHHDYGHSESDTDSSDDTDTDDDGDKENRRGMDVERGRRPGRRIHDIYGPPTPNHNVPGPSLQHRPSQSQPQPQPNPPVELKWYEVPARIGPGPGPPPRPPPRLPSPSPEPEFNRSRSKWGSDRRRPGAPDSQSTNNTGSDSRPAPFIPPPPVSQPPVFQQQPSAPVIPPMMDDTPRRRRRNAPSEEPWERPTAPPENLTDPSALAQYQFEEQRRRYEEEREAKRAMAERQRQLFQIPPSVDERGLTREQQAEYEEQQRLIRQQERHAPQRHAPISQPPPDNHIYQQPVLPQMYHHHHHHPQHPPAMYGAPHPWMPIPPQHRQPGGHPFRN